MTKHTTHRGILNLSGPGKDDSLNLIIEVTDRTKKDKEPKVSTARNLWVPAVNNCGRFGRWAFIEIKDPWNAATLIRDVLQTGDFRP